MKNIKSRIAIAVLIVATMLLSLGLTAFAAEAAEPSLYIAGANLSFSENVYIKYAVEAENVNEADVRMLIWTAPQAEYVYGTHTDVIEPKTDTIGGVEYLVFNYTKLAAKQMTDTVYARACVKIDGEYVYSNVKKYSILKYAYNKMGKTGTAGEQSLIDLLGGMLQYGASAQKLHDYKEDRLANANFYQVSVVGGLLPDGSDWELGLPGDKVTAVALDKADYIFDGWKNSAGDIVSTDKSFTITVGNANEVYTASYTHDHKEYTAVVTPPTVQSMGYTTYTCKGCGYSYNDDFVDMLESLKYVQVGEGLYVQSMGTYPSLDVIVGNEIIGLPITGIDDGAFSGSGITSISFGTNIEYIGSNAFSGCTDLEIYFDGTLDEWYAIEKKQDWDNGINGYTVYTASGDGDWNVPID